MTAAETTAIRTFLQDRRIKQRALAAALGITPSAVSQVLSGKMPLPDLGEWLAALSAVTGEDVYLRIYAVAYDGKLVRYNVMIEATEPGRE